MAAYVQQGAKETKKQRANELLQVAESNQTYETRELSAERTLKSGSDHHGTVRTRLLKNPTVLDTLDSVHRSLLFNNLKFEPDAQSSSNGSHASPLTDHQTSNAEVPLESATATRKDLALVQHEDWCYGKVNIAAASTCSDRGANEENSASGLTPGNDDATVDEEKDTLEDWNNNNDGESWRCSRVKMMVQQFEKANETAGNASRTQEAIEAGRTFSTEPPFHRGASMGDVETSDFESASVTSGSSAADGGWRSLRTSSAFSEGSRDVASIDRFDLLVAETQGATVSPGCHQPDDQGGHNTMITININYRCDTNPLRTSNNGVTGSATEPAEKAVDIVVSAPGQAVDFKSCAGSGRKSTSSSDTFGADDVRQLKKGQTELMDLEEDLQVKSFAGVCGVDPHSENKSSNCTENKTDHYAKQRRSSLATNRSCQTPEHEEYHDCDELHDSTLSFYEQATSQPVTPQDAEKKRRSKGQNCSSTSSCGDNNDVLDDAGGQPMIRIVQELAEDHGEVISTITLNKAQIKEMQKINGSVVNAVEDEKPEKRRKSRGSGDMCGSKKRHDKTNLHRQQRIIDDNFCNEILDSTIHFDRLYGINRGQGAGVGEAAPLSPSPTRAREEGCFSDSVVCDIASPGDESFDSGMSVGKLEGKPRYSGKTVGRLMMKRLKKLQQATTKGGAGPSGAGGHKLDTSDASTSSSQALQTSGPKKPPRTFANSPKRTTLGGGNTAPSCPMREDLDDSEPSENGIGWKVDATKPKSLQVGWTVPAAEELKGKNLSIPAQVYSMLHYSEDESRKRLIKTGNSKPAPQQSSAAKSKVHKQPCKGVRNVDPLGPKLDIDTVDGAKTPSPRRHSSSTDFDRFVRESNVKSTPHRRGEQQQHNSRVGGGTSSAGTRRLIEQFLSEERQNNSAHRKLPAVPAPERRRRTTGGIFERRRQQQENFLDDARRSNHEPRRRKTREAVALPQQPPGTTAHECCPMAARQADSMVRSNGHSGASAGGKVAKRRTFRKAALLKRTRTLFEASKKKIWSIKKFETPKKMNTVSNTTTPSGANGHDPNINRNSSAKKKQNLHHKHLGYTPDHVRCKSCHSRPVRRAVQHDEETDVDGLEELEEAIVPRTHRATQQAVPHRAPSPGEVNQEHTTGRGRNVEINRKSARSLNFASAPRPQASPTQHVEEGERMSPRKSGMQLLNETKFLKTLRNLKISPKRMFRFASQSSTAGTENCPMADRENHGQGEFQSFDDLNLDNVAHMGDFLSNIRRMVDGSETEQSRPVRQTFENSSFRQVEVHGKQQRSPMEENDEEEPIYQEISPKVNKTILNEFISTETNKRYLMVNNNPNILYATVSKTRGGRARPGLLARARSLTNVASVGATDPIVTSTPVSKQQNNTSKSQMKPSNRPAVAIGGRDKCQDRDVESESYLYSTAVAESSCHCPARHYPERMGGRSIAPSATKATTGSSIRRSLFSEGSSRPSTRERTDQSGLSTDESDVSVLQDEYNTDSGTSGRARGQEREEKIVTEPPIVRERVEDRLLAGVTVRREHERFQQRPAPAGRGNGSGCRDEDIDQYSFEKDIIVEERKEIKRNDQKDIGVTNGQAGPEGSGRPILSVFPKKTNNVVGAAPLGCFDTDSEIESLRRYGDKEIEELVVTLHENVTLSDMGSLETGTTASSVANDIDTIGYDTVDLAPPVARVFRCAPGKYDNRNLTIDTVDVSELISHPGDGDTFATSNVSPIRGSPSSGGKNSSSSGAGSTVMRNLKDKLRSSFRKSKSFIKSERQRFANLLEERPGSKASTATSSSASCSSSTSSSPQKRAVKLAQQNAPLAVIDQDTESAAYRSLADGSSAIISLGSMTELSNQYMSDLILQIKRQADARKQLKQALAICRTTREFECSPELIEAERLLLLATLKETAARNELSQIDYAANGMTLAKRKRVGVVALNHFEFPLKDTAISDALFNYFYVVVCTYKDQVKGTVATERRSDGRVYFRDCEIRFHDLDADYEIRVEVFVLRLRKNMKNYSFESRYHLDKDTQKRTLGCPSPSKKLREAGRMLSFRSTSPKSFDFDNEFSRFKSQGFLTLTSFALLTSSGGGPPESGQTTFEATNSTARTDYRSDLATTFSSVQDGGEPSATHSPYYSVSSNFQQLIRRQGNENVFLVEDFKYLTLDSMAYTSNMAGTIGMSVNSEVRFEGSDVCGFLDVGEKGDGGNGISWNRRWCKVNGFALEFWNYPQECQEKQPIQCIDLVRCVNDRIELAERSICSRPRTVKVDIFASKVAAAGASCNSSGIGSYKSTGATTSPNSGAEAQSMASGSERLRAMSPTGGRGQNTVTCFLLAADTQADLKRWLTELNRVVKFLKEWKI